MPTYLCKWSDETGTLVSCRNEGSLSLALDQEGDARDVIYKEIKTMNYVSIQIKVTKRGEADDSAVPGGIAVPGPRGSLMEFPGYVHDFSYPLEKLFDDPEGWKRVADI